MRDTLITIIDLEGRQVFLPAAQVAYWSIDQGGALAVYPVGGPVIWPGDKATVLTQLGAAGLLPDTRVTPEFSAPPEVPELTSRPPASPVAPQKGKQR